MPNPLLTIAIPTHNRAKCLRVLLNRLAQELNGLEGRVLVIIADNGSSDETPMVTAAFLTLCPSATIVRHSHNIGAEENFLALVALVRTRYLWLFGDDDAPKERVVHHVVGLLERERIDLLHLRSEWLPDISRPNRESYLDGLEIQIVKSTEFSRLVHVWVTFISGMVVNLERLRELHPDLNMRRFLGTGMVQLIWVLPLLMGGDEFRIANRRCVLATAGNSGGYRACEVFGTNFPAVVHALCGLESPQSLGMLRGLTWQHIPRVIWGVRFSKIGNFPSEDILAGLEPLRGSPAYQLIYIPLVKLPRLLARPFLTLSQLLYRVTLAGYWIAGALQYGSGRGVRAKVTS